MSKEFVPFDLLCEYIRNPLGIDATKPRLSWKAGHHGRGQYQTAYHVLVASSEKILDQDKGDMWDSGMVDGCQSVNVEYEGKALSSRQKYYWKVRIWDKDGAVSSYSETGWFEMGLLETKDWEGEWIGYPGHKYGCAPLFRKEFNIKKEIKSARIYICGLGYYELSINGKKVGDRVLDPGFTDYSKRVLYAVYDVAGYLVGGQNVVGIMLGEGWYGHTHDSFIRFMNQLPHWNSSPRLLLQMNIEYDDGTFESVVSGRDNGWFASKGPIMENGIYNGETYDARLEQAGWDIPGFRYNIEGSEEFCWQIPAKVESPGGILQTQVMEPIKVIKEIRPIKLTMPKPDVYVFDMGQNFAGWARIKVQGKRGQQITMKFAEVLYDDGIINQENLRGARATDTYILKGDGLEVYEPRFTYHGFRYVQLEGYPGIPDLDTITGRVVSSAVKQTGSFSCSNKLLDKIQECVLWTERSNLHSVATDCCQRDERMAWTNDITVRAEESIYNFNLATFYEKWMNDLNDCPGQKDGTVSDTVPYVYGGVNSDHISSSYIVVPWLLYLYYNDKRILEANYDRLKRYIEFLGSQSEDYIVEKASYGEWAPPMTESIVGEAWDACPANIPKEVITTGYYYYDTIILSKIARILGKKADATEYSILAGNIKEAFNHRFLDRATSNYSTGSQACNVFPLFLGIVPEENKNGVLENLVKDVVELHGGHLTTGNQTTKYLMEVLSREGRNDVAYMLATQTTCPSWGYMISMGATTIWERWEYLTGKGMNSHSHPMNCTISSWFYKILGGLNVDEDQPGFKKIIIRPAVINKLSFVDACVETVMGRVESHWENIDNTLKLEITIPFNSSARVFVPKLADKQFTILEGNKVIWKNGRLLGSSMEISFEEEIDQYVIFSVGSGKYNFQTKV